MITCCYGDAPSSLWLMNSKTKVEGAVQRNVAKLCPGYMARRFVLLITCMSFVAFEWRLSLVGDKFASQRQLQNGLLVRL